MESTAIDISSYNGHIDWNGEINEVKTIIIRCGYGKDAKKHDDKMFVENIESAIERGMKIGVYLTSYAIDEDGAISEAEHTLRLVEPYKDKISLPVFLDVGESGTEAVSKRVIEAWSSKLEEQGYRTGVLCSDEWYEKYLKSLDDNIFRWIRTKEDAEKPDALLWQYTAKGKIDGIRGYVNMSKYENKGEDFKPVEKPKKKSTKATKKVAETPEYKGEYVVNSRGGLNMRRTASFDGEVIAVLPKGVKLICDGDYVEEDGKIWLFVHCKLHKGYCVLDYLER